MRLLFSIATVLLLLPRLTCADFDFLFLQDRLMLDRARITNLVLRVSQLEFSQKHSGVAVKINLEPQISLQAFEADEFMMTFIKITLCPYGELRDRMSAMSEEQNREELKRTVKETLIEIHENMLIMAGLSYDVITDYEVIVDMEMGKLIKLPWWELDRLKRRRKIDSTLREYLRKDTSTAQPSHSTIAAHYRDGIIEWGNLCGKGSDTLYFSQLHYLSLRLQDIMPNRGRYLKKVSKILDGAHLELNNEETIRLLGIELPDDETEAANAKAFLVASVLGDSVGVALLEGQRDLYGIERTYLYMGDTCINEMLISKGLAKVSPKYMYTKLRRYYKLEAEARKKRLGIWESYSDSCENRDE